MVQGQSSAAPQVQQPLPEERLPLQRDLEPAATLGQRVEERQMPTPSFRPREEKKACPPEKRQPGDEGSLSKSGTRKI